jgi:hypothetical protein
LAWHSAATAPWSARERSATGVSFASHLAPILLEQLRASWAGRNPATRPTTRQIPQVRIVSIVNAHDTSAARYVAELSFEGGVEPFTGVLRRGRTRELWTFRRNDGRWKLAAIDLARDASHHWEDPMIATAADDPAIHSKALFELAAADAVADETLATGLTRPAGSDTRHALADLALLDERFAWHLLEHVILRLVDAWMADAEQGSPDALLAIASQPSAATLLRPVDADSRAVVRALTVIDVTPLALRAHRSPVSLILAVTIRGMLTLRASESGNVLAGSRRRKALFLLRCRLVLDAGRPSGWRVDTVAPTWLRDALACG